MNKERLLDGADFHFWKLSSPHHGASMLSGQTLIKLLESYDAMARARLSAILEGIEEISPSIESSPWIDSEGALLVPGDTVTHSINHAIGLGEGVVMDAGGILPPFAHMVFVKFEEYAPSGAWVSEDCLTKTEGAPAETSAAGGER